ncbi:MAG: hypothetical protein KAI59_06685, partial [Planctomycetes bacterium]|nr:hypothetical protein [Planctomycetota bacterium]
NKSRKKGGNPWRAKFTTMFHQTNDAELFYTSEQLKAEKFKQDGPNWKKGKKIFLPLYEAKMFRQYDHRFGSVYVEEKNWINQGQTIGTTLVDHQNPEYVVEPRWWISESSIASNFNCSYFLAFRDITRATDSRTMIASFIPKSGVLNTAPLILTGDTVSDRKKCCLLGNFNSFVLDFIVRQKIGHIHLNFFIVEQLPVLAPDFYEDTCPWSKDQTLEDWISERVLKLTCTSNDMLPLAEAAGFKPKVHKWKTVDRAKLMAELDAAFFILYEIKREDVEYVLSTFSGLKKNKEGLLDSTTTTSQILKYYDQFCK